TRCAKLVALQGCLRSTWPVHKNQARVGALRRGACRSGWLSLLPRTECFLNQRLQRGQLDVSADDQRRIIREIVLLPEFHQILARYRLERIRGPDVRIPVRMVRSEERRVGK